MGVLGSLEWLSQEVDRHIERRFTLLGGCIVRNPRKFLFIPVLIALACGSGMINLEIESNNENLYTPQDSESFDDRAKIKATFGEQPVQGFIYAVAEEGGAQDLINQQALLDWYDTWHNVTTYKVVFRGVQDYSTICTKKNGQCSQASVLALWDYNRSLIASKTDTELRQDFNDANGFATEQDGTIIPLKSVVATLGDDNLQSPVIGLRLDLYMQNDKEKVDGEADRDEETYIWTLQVYDMVLERRHWTSLDVYAWLQSFQDEEAGKAIGGDILFLQTGFVLLLVYATIVLSRRSPFSVHTHGSLALISFSLGGLATLASFGLGLWFGLEFSTVVAILAFLLLGLSVDDTFVIHAAYMEKELMDLPLEERVAKALGRAGSSITVTSMTDMFAFLAGSYTDIPAIQTFCLFAAIGVFFDFLLQITTFVACLVMVAEREAAGRLDYACCIKAKDPKEDNKDYEEPLTRFMKNYYAPALLSPIGKSVVIVGTIGLVSFSAWAAQELEVDFDYEDFVPSDSTFRDTIDIREEYFGTEAVLVGFYTFKADYSSVAVQTQMTYYSNGVENLWAVEPGTCDNWWPAFLKHVNDTEPSKMIPSAVEPNILIINPVDFQSTLDVYLNGTGEPYASNLRFGSQGELEASSMQCLLTAESQLTLFRIDQMDACRAVGNVAPLVDPIAFNFRFLFWDGYKEVREQVFLNIILAGLAVFVIGVILLGNFTAAFCVLLMIACIDLEILGMLWYWDEYFNYVTGINLVLAVGLSVDANAHIAHSFLRAEGTGNERAEYALIHIGRSVLNGVISTSLVLIPLIFSVSYIFTVFGKCILAIMIHSAWHGLAVLPVLLSIVKPASYGSIRAKHLSTAAKEGTEMSSVNNTHTLSDQTSWDRHFSGSDLASI